MTGAEAPRLVRLQGARRDRVDDATDPAGEPFSTYMAREPVDRQLLRALLDGCPDGILILDRQGQFVTCNRRYLELRAAVPEGLGPTETRWARAAGDPAIEVAPSVDPECGDGPGKAAGSGLVIETRSSVLTGPDGGDLGRAWYFRDVTDQRRELDRAMHMARSDGLTGLATREVFIDALARSISQANRGGPAFAVICLDLDRFKAVNDALGHPAGDELLRTVATRLRSTTRASDTVARFGGDEFAIIASNLDEPSQVVPLAEKLIKVVNEPFTIAGRQIEVAVSLGIDFFSASAADAETLLRHADMALYRAKAKGRGSFQFFTRSMDRQVRNRMGLARELHEAVSGDQLFLLYQPQVELSTGTVTGVEALVRWRHPHRGVLRPARFIPVAEETGLIGRVGGWVATTALGHARRWPSDPRGARRLAINVSARQFTGHSTFDRELQRLLAGPDCGPLELEFTEAALFKISRDHADVLRTLRRLDVAIAIDDFGTGYSSLDHLRSLPVARIKLAQTYVRRIEESVGDASIVRATIGLARELGIRVIAEGVETAGQVELLRAWGCQEGQGYAFARPMAAGAVRALLAGGEALAPTNASSKRPATSSEAPLAPISR